jgi:Fe(3+) dicitrate transport protein
LKAELGRSRYLYQIPGPLTDSLFLNDPRSSTRSRNYYSPDIYVPSLVLLWKAAQGTDITITASGVFGNRSSVQFDAFANVPDAIDPATGAYKPRQVDIDNFNSRTVELRLLRQWGMGKLKSTLATGIAYMNNDLHRRQLGKGTSGSDYDLTVTPAGFARDLHFKTGNVAVYAENAFRIGTRLTITPGIRLENGASDMSGVIAYYQEDSLPITIRHRFALAGISAQYLLNSENMAYGGVSQAYRPVIFKDIVPASTYEQIDKNLKNATGYNLEAGIRGKLLQHLQYDVSLFSLLYKNRMGTLVFQDSAGQSYTYKTNIGNSRTSGIELFLQYKFPVINRLYLGLFTSTSYMDARYTTGQVSTGSTNKPVAGNKVEGAPDWISRNGLEILYKGFSATLLYSHTAASFSDALNTVTPPASGARGLTPAYSIWDFNASLRAGSFTIRTGVNNLFNKQYFTKRPAFYPGPGIWPSDGRNAYVTIGIRL